MEDRSLIWGEGPRVVTAVRELAQQPTMSAIQVVEWLEGKVDARRRRAMAGGNESLAEVVKSRGAAAIILERNAKHSAETGDVATAIMSAERATGIRACIEGLEKYLAGGEF